MKVTRVKINSYTPNSYGTCASVTVYLDNSLVIHQIRVVNGKRGLFIAFPNTGNMKLYSKNGEKGKKRYDDIVHPCTEDLRKEITEKVLEAYEGYHSN